MVTLFLFMKADIKFHTSVHITKQLPKENLKEIVLCGRSNVGKSSFINSLFNQKNLAKTSSHPGKTKSINYYIVNGNFFIVDLPGFGYAKVSKTERDRWQKLIESYFFSGREITHAFHLIDSRHSPTQLDIVLQQFLLEANIPCSIILTKVDKLKQSEISHSKKIIKEYFSYINIEDDVFLYSSVKGTGKKQLTDKILRILE